MLNHILRSYHPRNDLSFFFRTGPFGALINRGLRALKFLKEKQWLLPSALQGNTLPLGTSFDEEYARALSIEVI
jgi:hypothetical protein